MQIEGSLLDLGNSLDHKKARSTDNFSLKPNMLTSIDINVFRYSFS